VKTLLRGVQKIEESGPAKRFTFGVIVGVFMVLGMWLVTRNNPHSGLHLSWPLAGVLVVVPGLLVVASTRKLK
jgi:hypothetical protein